MRYFFTYSPNDADPNHKDPEDFLQECWTEEWLDKLRLYITVENFFDNIHPHVHGLIESNQRQDKLRESIYRLMSLPIKGNENLFHCSRVKNKTATQLYLYKNMEEGGTIIWDKVGFADDYNEWKSHRLTKISKYELLTLLESKVDFKYKDSPVFEFDRRDFVKLLGTLIKEGYDVLAHQYQIPQIYNTLKTRLGGSLCVSDVFKDSRF